MEKKKYFLDIAHMHPVCPLSLSHARIFVLQDYGGAALIL
jgi:hypothetical protein